MLVNVHQFWSEREHKLVKVYTVRHGGEDIIRTSNTIKALKYVVAVWKEICKDEWLLSIPEDEQNREMERRGCLEAADRR